MKLQKQELMEELNVFNLGDLGVKSYEILFQKKVEDTLEANGFKECWWQALNHEPIFMTIWGIYSTGSSKDHSVIFSLQEYYNKIKKMTDSWVGEKLCK